MMASISCDGNDLHIGLPPPPATQSRIARLWLDSFDSGLHPARTIGIIPNISRLRRLYGRSPALRPEESGEDRVLGLLMAASGVLGCEALARWIGMLPPHSLWDAFPAAGHHNGILTRKKQGLRRPMLLSFVRVCGLSLDRAGHALPQPMVR